MHKLITAPNKILRTPCAPVNTYGDYLQQLTREMIGIMQTYNGIGLAAPQVGESIRLIVVKRQGKKGVWVVVNPEICQQSPYTNTAKEGCLSYPGKFVEIERPNAVSVKGFDVFGNKICIDSKGLEARIMCHEVDHCDGCCAVGK